MISRSFLRLLVVSSSLMTAAGCAKVIDQRPWVHKIRFQGAKKVAPGELKKKIATEETSWVPLAKKRRLSRSALDLDKKRVEAFYQSRGYFDAKVTRAEAIKRPKRRSGDSVDVVIAVEEGEPTKIRAVRVLGLEPLGAEAKEWPAALPVKVGQVFEYDRYTEAKARLLGQLLLSGFPWAEVEGQVAVDRDARVADVELTARSGPRAVFGAATVEGAVRVNPKLLARHADVPVGRRFSPAELEAIQGRLYALGVFSSVKVEVVRDSARAAKAEGEVDAAPAQSPDEVAAVRITVREGTFRNLRVGAGLGLETGRTEAHIKLVYSQKNFLGGLRTLRLRLEPGYVALPAFWDPKTHGPALLAEAQLVQPHFPFHAADSQFLAGYDVSFDYLFRYHGPRVQFGSGFGAWANRLRFSLSYNAQFLFFFDTDASLLSDPAQAGRLYGYVDPYLLGYFQEQISLDLRDRPMDARKGGYFALTAEQGGVYYNGEVNSYESLLADVRGYLPLGSRVVVAARVQWGHVFHQGTLGSPITRRFYSGGPNSHRGFSFNRLAPQVISGDPALVSSYFPVGGDKLLLGQAELRVDLFKLFGSWFSFAGFFDAGDVTAAKSATDFGIDWARLHFAVGGGLRYATVVGTVRFDLGVRLNRLDPMEPDGLPNPDPNQRVAFHISIGEAF